MTTAPLRAAEQSAPAGDPPLQREIELLRSGRFDEAELALTAAHAQNPARSDALHLLASLRARQGREREALDLVKRALKLRPHDPEALALQHLLRSQVDSRQEQAKSRPAVPRWNGGSVAGALLVSGEEGLGEQILYASMVPDLLNRADTIIVEVEPRLTALFTRSFPHVRVVPIGSAGSSVAAQAPMSSLPRHLRSRPDACRSQGFLAPDQARARSLRERLAGDGRVVVGLSWKGRKNPRFGEPGHCRLLDFASILRLPNCRFVDLQRGDTHAERAETERAVGVPLEHFDDVDITKDIDELAALISACDIVVTVSNVTAHLAGGIGRPTWVFLPRAPACPWYWFEDRCGSAWYPHVRLKRQSSGQSWAELIASSADEIW